MGASLAWDKQWDLVVELVKRLPSFRIKGHCHGLPIVIGPCSSVNGQQADVNMRLYLLFRYSVQFGKSQDGHQVPRQGTGSGLTPTMRGRTLCPGCRRSREQLLHLLFQRLNLALQYGYPALQWLCALSRQMSR